MTTTKCEKTADEIKSIGNEYNRNMELFKTDMLNLSQRITNNIKSYVLYQFFWPLYPIPAGTSLPNPPGVSGTNSADVFGYFRNPKNKSTYSNYYDTIMNQYDLRLHTRNNTNCCDESIDCKLVPDWTALNSSTKITAFLRQWYLISPQYVNNDVLSNPIIFLNIYDSQSQKWNAVKISNFTQAQKNTITDKQTTFKKEYYDIYNDLKNKYKFPEDIIKNNLFNTLNAPSILNDVTVYDNYRGQSFCNVTYILVDEYWDTMKEKIYEQLRLYGGPNYALPQILIGCCDNIIEGGVQTTFDDVTQKCNISITPVQPPPSGGGGTGGGGTGGGGTGGGTGGDTGGGDTGGGDTGGGDTGGGDTGGGSSSIFTKNNIILGVIVLFFMIVLMFLIFFVIKSIKST
jgi:hypothetical protein